MPVSPRRRYPLWDWLLEWYRLLSRYARRSVNLPGRLLTPVWYPAKYRHLRAQWLATRRPLDL